MQNLGTVLFRGRSGEQYRFQVWPIGTKFKALAAVCVFSKRIYCNRNFSSIASHDCVHIWHTEDLSTLGYDEADIQGSNCICVYLAPDARRRVLVERDLTESLGLWKDAFQRQPGTNDA